MKSECKIEMERCLLEAVYQMATESCSPDIMDKVDDVMLYLHDTRGLGSFNTHPRKER